MSRAYYCTVKELNELGKENIPDQFKSNMHLIYSSPATLAFNSPGAEGFGVKRAGLAIPDSIMLIVAPGCCGRNTSLISSMREYDNRFFYLMMDETDIVTGRHLKKIPKAVEEICERSIRTDFSEVFYRLFCRLSIRSCIKSNSQHRTKCLILILYFICLIQASKLNKRNLQTLMKVLCRCSCFLVKYQIEVRFGHRFVFIKIPASGDFMDCFYTRTVQNIIQLTIIH